MREQEDRKFDDLLGDDIRKFSMDKAPDNFSMDVMKRLAFESRAATQGKEVRGGMVVKEDTLIGRRGRWFMLFICLAVIVYGYTLGGPVSSDFSYLDQVAQYFSKLTLPTVSPGFDMSSPGWLMLTMAMAGILLLVLADKVMGRLFGGLRF
jgi:hypothetical protein